MTQLPNIDTDEIEIICSNCGYPTTSTFDEKGRVIEFTQEAGPKDEQEAEAQGWHDHGLGWYCPKCSLGYLEERALEEAEGQQTGAGDLGSTIDSQFLKSMHPDVSDETIAIFVDILSRNRLARLRARAGLTTIDATRNPPIPKDEKQAKEFIEVSATIRKAIEQTMKEKA